MRHPMKRALVYTRDASRMQNGGATDQLRACEAYAREHGFVVVGHYDDLGSGLRIGEGLRALRAAINRGECEAVVARDSSRFSRSAAYLRDFLCFAQEQGVAVVLVEEGIWAPPLSAAASWPPRGRSMALCPCQS